MPIASLQALPDEWRRALAFLLDFVATVVVCLAVRLFSPWPWWAGLAYVLAKDLLVAGRSPGKWVVGLSVRGPGGQPCGPAKLVLRNITLLPPATLVELLVTAFSHDQRRLGDVWAGTHVDCGSAPAAAAEPAEPPSETPGEGPVLQEMPALDEELLVTPPAMPALGSAPPIPPLEPGSGAGPATPHAIPPLDDTSTPAMPDLGPGPGPLPPPAMPAFEDTSTPAMPDLGPGPTFGTLTPPPAAAPKHAPAAHEILGVSPGADEDAVEDAYWEFVDAYSEDAVKDLSDDALEARCQELRDRFAAFDLSAFTVPVAYKEGMATEERRTFVAQFVIAVNAARDKMLGGG